MCVQTCVCVYCLNCEMKSNYYLYMSFKVLMLFFLSLAELHVFTLCISLFSGQIAKVKLCSCDGETGFGWTKNTFGKKKWGFLRTSHFDTKTLSATRMYKGPQKLRKGCASAATDVN